jgi:CO/xanthine dehydrogenase Mo-binding subunit
MDEEKTLSDKLSGRLKHPEDAGGKRAFTGKILRSPVAEGSIASIELPEKPSGLVSIVSRDIPGAGKIKFGGVPVPILSGRKILWEGQPILAAAGPDPEEVENWLSRIQLEINEPEKQKTPEIKEKLIEKGSPGRAFSKAFQVIEEVVEIPSSEGSARPSTVVCVKDGSNYTIHTATSWPGAVRSHVARVLKTNKEYIRVRPYSISPGSNREMWNPAVEACRASLLSYRAKRSVRLSSSPTESRLYGPGIPGAEFHVKGAIDGEGRILAIEAEFTILAGAVFPLESEFLERVILGLFSIYPCRNYSIRARIRYDNIPPSGFGPAAGFELGFLAGEMFASRVAENSLSPPGGWRRESFPVPGQAYGPGIALPKDFAMGEILNKALGVSDFERKSASFEQTRLARQSLDAVPEFFRGIGLGCAWFGNGFLSSPKELGAASLTLTMGKNGDLTVYMPAQNPGGSLQRAWSDISGKILGIDGKSVTFSGEIPSDIQDPGPSILGRNVSIYTKLLELAGNDLAKRRFRDALPISTTRNRRRSGIKSWDPDSLEGSPFENTSWGVGIVEVAISTVTFEVHPTRIWLVIDGGNLLMPDHAKSSVESAVEEALTWCSFQSGKRELPLVDIQSHDSNSKRPPRDVTTIPWLLLPSAYLQAVRQASGISVGRIPVTPELLRNEGIGR